MKILKFYDLVEKKAIKIYEECSDESKYLKFDHIDGMYGHCVTEKGGVIHLLAVTPLEKYKDGYKIKSESHLKPQEVPAES